MGRKQNGRSNRDNGSTSSSSEARCGEVEYGMVSADGGWYLFLASSNNTGFLGKILKWKADVLGESTKCAMFKIKAAEEANLRVSTGMLKGDAELKISFYVKV